jgi:ribose 5-phosphate isomerase A
MDLKQKAAQRALDFVGSGMVLGLGSGSTSAYFVNMLGEKLKTGELRGIIGVATSEATAAQARALNIPITTLAKHPILDLAVDGADEVDPQLNLIKGLGRALLREKVVEIHAQQFVVIVDQSKLVKRLGLRGPLPVEIIQFEADSHISWLNTLPGCQATVWLEKDGTRVLTDNGNNLALCRFETGIADAYAIAQEMAVRPGIVENGLFLDMATQVIVAGEQGVSLLERPK